ncbi:MAG: anti-sigma factor family protein [Nitrospinota bacterium]
MDQFDRLSEHFVEGLEDRRASTGPECLPPTRLEAYLADRITPEERAQVEAHLNGCLSCLNAMVELRDLLSGMASPGVLSPSLETRLNGVIAETSPAQQRRQPKEGVSTLRTIGNHTFHLRWVRPRNRWGGIRLSSRLRRRWRSKHAALAVRTVGNYTFHLP